MKEELAALLHEIAAGWEWKRQWGMSYGVLSEEEKKPARRQADKVLALLNECFATSGRMSVKVE